MSRPRGTDYDLPGYAGRFDVSRRLTPAALITWSQLLSAAACGTVTTILDLGAGTGRFWPVLRHAFPGAQIVAIDIAATALNHAHATLERVSRVVGDVSQAPLESLQSDFVFCSMLLHLLDNPAQMLARLRISLRTQGRVFIRQGIRETVDSFLFLKFFPTALKIERERMPTSETLLTIIRDSGLSIVQETRVLTPPASTIDDYLARVKERGFPSLQLLSDNEFDEGIAQLQCYFHERSIASMSQMCEACPVFVCEFPSA